MTPQVIGSGPPSPLRPGAVDPGTAVLITGPPMTGKRRLLFDLLGGVEGRAAITVTTKQSAAQVKAALLGDRDPSDWEVRVVDCVSRQQAVGPVTETDDVRYVTSAADLTGISIAAAEFMYEFHENPDRQPAGVGLHSLSTMLMYSDIRRVYQFLHVLTGRVRSSRFVGAFTFDSIPGDTESESRLKQLFDARVEVREGNERPELRVRGGEFGPRTWTAFGD